MKKKLAIALMTLSLFLSGCGERIIKEYGQEVSKIGPYIEISRTDVTIITRRRNCNVDFITAYREDSKVVYEIVMYGSYNSMDIHELYTYDEEGHPILQFYEDGKIVTKGGK